MGNMETSGLAHCEQELIDQFLADNVLFLGPDPEIMHEHDISPRTAVEESAMQTQSDPAVQALVRDRLQAGANESFEMLEQIDPDFDVWAYFLNPTLQKVLGL